jgi:protein ImuB
MPPADKSPASARGASPTPAVKRQQSLALELQPAAKRELPRATPLTRLWLCIHLSALPLESLRRDNTNSARTGFNERDDIRGEEAARAVFDEQDGLRKVLLANCEAQSAGIRPGFSVNAALALLPTLELEQRDLQCEQRTLLSLAGWAEQFTSFVAIEAPTVLLLELAGSVRLFTGLQKLRQTISEGLGEQGFSAALAIAPTPLAATWLAKAGRRVCIQDTANLGSALGALPLTCLGWPSAVYESLYGMGVSHIGDCLRLPRQGFAKRFGAGRLLELDRAVGRLPDPRVSYRTPERFVTDYELDEELSDSELILNACRVLLQKLEQFLLTRQLAVQHIKLEFFHLQHPATALPLGCVQPDRAVKHWFELLRIRFERLPLPAPVIAIRLQAGQGQPASAYAGILQFSKKDRQRQSLSIAHLIERLGARIGDELVHGVSTVAEHRPHYAWRPELALSCLPQREAVPALWNTRRPLWLLTHPEPLAVRDGHPLYQGVLAFEDGPERIETGWWDEDGIARDYFIAVNPKGVRLWVYRNRSKDDGWYLHGIFG